MILSFRDRHTEEFWRWGTGQRIPANVRRVAMRKLKILGDAASLDDLRVPPGNHLEALRRDRSGQHSIRINDRFRICFVWKDGHAYEVEITDYH